MELILGERNKEVRFGPQVLTETTVSKTWFCIGWSLWLPALVDTLSIEARFLRKAVGIWQGLFGIRPLRLEHVRIQGFRILGAYLGSCFRDYYVWGFWHSGRAASNYDAA